MSAKDLPSPDAAPGGDSAGPRSRRSIVAIVLGVLFVLYVGAGYFVPCRAENVSARTSPRRLILPTTIGSMDSPKGTESGSGGRVRDLIPEADYPPRGPGRTRALSDAALEALAAQIVIGDADCRTLARARAAAIQGAILASELVSADRVVLVDVEVGPVGEADRVPTELALSTE